MNKKGSEEYDWHFTAEQFYAVLGNLYNVIISE